MHVFLYFTKMVVIFQWLWFLCVTTLNLGMSHAQMKVRCNGDDQLVLSSFKQSIKDPSNQLSSWSIEEDCCKWSGVVCNNITGSVTELHLPCSFTDFHDTTSGCLGGEINMSDLFKLESLNFLDLSRNDFEAIHLESTKYQSHSLSLKDSSGANLSNLLYLDLSYNYNLHVDNLRWVAHFSSLKYINMSGIQLYDETLWLQWMTMPPSLVELRLSGCGLQDVINPSLAYVNFTSLEVIDISFNQFEEIPKWLFNHSGSSISYMDLSFNYLKGQIPEVMLNFQHLEFLILTDNKLNGSIPEWMGQFKYLKHLDLQMNMLSGPIPTTIGNLSLLTYLDVSRNRLNGSLPTTLGQLSKLETLWIAYNSLSGNLSEQSFTKLWSLKDLRLDSTAFIFNFGTHWQPPFQLKEISMKNCKLGPDFPSWLYTQRSLNFLDISSSGLSFNLQDELWSFVTKIKYLFLFNNSISGDISATLITSTTIDLSSNNFTGRLPQLSPEVTFFNIAKNNFSGSIHPLSCQNTTSKQKLAVLDMSYNLLSGEFPDCWMHWPSLIHLNLEGNNLTGKISDSVGLLVKLESLRLGNNSLSGGIPSSLQNCKYLWFLDLSFNEFTGNIPSWIRSLNMALILRSNKLNGSIPSEICQLSNLLVLDLAHNKLSGPIPKCLQNITTMVTNTVDEDLFDEYVYQWNLAPFSGGNYLHNLPLFVKNQHLDYWENFKFVRIVDLSSNELSGSIPSELFSLMAVLSLNVSHNHLMGNISSDIGHMKSLESLDLSGNLLSGEIPQSMSNLSFLNTLNLSYNNFHGRIPLGTQLQSFEASSYAGNPDLCGPPLPQNCTQEGKQNDLMKIKDDDFTSSFKIGMGIGFASAFWGVFGTLLFIRKWRHAYFQLLETFTSSLS